MASRPTLGVVITNYNTWDLTLRCAERVLAYAGGLDEILILDDASSTPPPRPLDPRLRLETNAQNLGLVKSLNRAMATLRTDVAVLFDSDAYPENDFTEPLRRAFAEEDRLAVVGFATVDAEGRPTGSCEPEPGLASLLLGQRLHAGWLRWFAPKDGPISVYTCAMAIRRTAFAELGGFDESFDWLDLDHELSMKVNRSTWHLRRMPELLAYHEGSGTPQTTNARVLRFYKTRYRLLTKF
ncbi:MAG TPA: glycosyltransferase, partial [Thermoanaerobaculia bacterium]|nr:glycosyltransferase [Thermoanaerobaculia bacterium]